MLLLCIGIVHVIALSNSVVIILCLLYIGLMNCCLMDKVEKVN